MNFDRTWSNLIELDRTIKYMLSAQQETVVTAYDQDPYNWDIKNLLIYFIFPFAIHRPKKSPEMAGVSLQCGDCGALLKSVEEAQEHAELTSHSNFSESTEPVLNLVCTTCSKPCRSKTVSHPQFLIQTLHVAIIHSVFQIFRV